MRCSITRPRSLGPLDAAQRYTLTLALSDAISHRTPRGQCPDCAGNPVGLCVDHAEDMDCIAAYRDLARHFGLGGGR